jgi:hypothetical protein
MTAEFERRYQRYLRALRPQGRKMTQADLLKLRRFIRNYEHAHIGRPPPVEAEIIDVTEARAILAELRS